MFGESGSSGTLVAAPRSITRLFNLTPISAEAFFTEYWRKKPLYIRGGARRLLGASVRGDDLEVTCQRLGAELPGRVYRCSGRVTFGQNIDSASESLRAVSDRYAQCLGGVHVWFDCVQATDGAGIGSHYDIADTFVLQQSGVKLWRLHDPAFIPKREVRLRVLNTTEVDSMYMPDDPLEFVLEPGDLLYLPLLWVHWGISQGDSSSLSLAFSARNALDVLPLVLRDGLGPSRRRPDSAAAVLDAAREPRTLRRLKHALWDVLYGRLGGSAGDGRPARTRRREPADDQSCPPLSFEVLDDLRGTLSKDPAWWGAVPVVWRRSPTEAPCPQSVAIAKEHVEGLVRRLSNCRPVLRRPRHSGRPPRHAVSASQVAPSPEREEDAPTDDQRIDPSPLPRPARGRLTWVGDPLELLPERLSLGAARSLAAAVGAVWRIRLARTMAGAMESVRSRLSIDTLRILSTAWRRAPEAITASVIRSGEVTGWIWRAAEALGFNYVPRVEALVSHLATLVLPDLLEAGTLPEGEGLALAPSARHHLLFRSWARSLESELPLGNPTRVRHRAGELEFGRRHGSAGLRMSRGPHTEAPGWTLTGGHWEPLLRLSATDIRVHATDSWLREYFPRGGGTVLARRGSPARLCALHRAMDSGRSLLGRVWPEAHDLVVGTITSVVPAGRVGNCRWQMSCQPFRGIVLAAPCPPAAAARILTREAGRTMAFHLAEFSGIVFENGTPESRPAPLSSRATPTQLFADVMAAAYELTLCRRARTIGATVPQTDAWDERVPASRAIDAGDTLSQSGRLTGSGRQLLERLLDVAGRRTLRPSDSLNP